MKKTFVLVLILLLLLVGGFFYFRYQIYYSHGEKPQEVLFEIKKGEGNSEVSQRLQDEGIISGKIYFYYYLRSHGLLNKIMPGTYELSGSMTIPEIAERITRKREANVSVTFPEGFSTRDMAERLKNNGLDGEGFLKLAENPGELMEKYDFLKEGKVKNLEGYLFPDTYFFKKDETPENIISKMLNNFESKLDDDLRKKIAGQNKTLGEIIVMASIVEKEVKTPEDMKVVAGIFWKRIAEGQKMQSDAPLSYILNDNDDQHSGKDLELDSPYNTYKYAGLPPGPISNPGLVSIQSAVNPQASDYNYFLTVTVDGESQVIFSKTFEEHVAARTKYGI